MRRLSQAGFKQDFVRWAILPDWWEDTYAHDPSLLQDVELRAARFLGLPLSRIRESQADLSPPPYSGAKLRRVRDVDSDRLGPAIHCAMQIAAAVVRGLRDTRKTPVATPSNGLAWREQIATIGPAITLDNIVADRWVKGIPVIPLDILPSPSFQGMACIVEGRPVILLGHKYDEPGRVAFVVAHETAHIAAGDCMANQPVVDEEDEISDSAEIEVAANQYATQVLVGKESLSELRGGDFKELARNAAQLERKIGADASVIISAWAAANRDYAKASMAWRALYRGSGARRQLRQHFDLHVDLEAMSESDRNLLRCIYGDQERDENDF